MTIKDLYSSIDEDFYEVLSRLMDEKRVEKFAVRFLDTTEFTELKNAIDKEDWDNAFLMAHTIKGIALNLGFSHYAKASSELTELLRPKVKPDEQKLTELFAATEAEYTKVIDALKLYKQSL